MIDRGQTSDLRVLVTVDNLTLCIKISDDECVEVGLSPEQARELAKVLNDGCDTIDMIDAPPKREEASS